MPRITELRPAALYAAAMGFALSLFLLAASLAGAYEKEYTRPVVRQFPSPHEFREWKKFAKVHGLRGIPDECHISIFPPGSEFVATNLVLVCEPLIIEGFYSRQ